MGAICVCWNFEKNQYVVAKIVKGKENSEEEAQLQRKAAGPNVWPIYNTIKDIKHSPYAHRRAG
jgi:hypothetical protein